MEYRDLLVYREHRVKLETKECRDLLEYRVSVVSLVVSVLRVMMAEEAHRALLVPKEFREEWEILVPKEFKG